MRKTIALSAAVAAAGLVILAVFLFRLEKKDSSPETKTGDLLSAALPRMLPESGEIVLQDENFSSGYTEIHDHRDEFYGRTIRFSGIAMTQDSLKPGEFLVGRNIMWCCEEDTYFTGFLAYFEGTTPTAGAKIAVEGILEKREYRSPESGAAMTLPAVRAAKVQADPTVQAYIRPAF